jgi:hypothetical protein
MKQPMDEIIDSINASIPPMQEPFDFFKPRLVRSPDACATCNVGHMRFDEQMYADVCTTCGVYLPRVIETTPLLDTIQPATFCSYLKSNHFREVLVQLTGRQCTTLNHDVIGQVQREMDRLGLRTIGLIEVRAILKSIGQGRLYEHAVYILNRLGQETPHLTPLEEELLMKQFVLVQRAYDLVKTTRVNMLNYYFILFKLCERNGHQHCLPFIPKLATRSLVIQNDVAWRVICSELDWEFVPTV